MDFSSSEDSEYPSWVLINEQIDYEYDPWKTSQNVAGGKRQHDEEVLVDERNERRGYIIEKMEESKLGSWGLKQFFGEQTNQNVPLERKEDGRFQSKYDENEEKQQNKADIKKVPYAKRILGYLGCRPYAEGCDSSIQFRTQTTADNPIGGTRSRFSSTKTKFGFPFIQENEKIHDSEIYKETKRKEENHQLSEEGHGVGGDPSIVHESDVKFTLSVEEAVEAKVENIKTGKKANQFGTQVEDKKLTGQFENVPDFQKKQGESKTLTNEPFNAMLNVPDIKTLEDALKYFGLYSRLQWFERRLEDVRRHRWSKEDHEKDFRQFDKEIQKLSFKYHPDKVKNRGGSDEDVAVAQKLQTALNATRTVLNILNEAFLKDIHTDQKYGFYTNLNISLLGNEDNIRSHIYEVLFKISLISEIKQQDIIAEIRMFLTESKNCIKSYFDNNVNDFEKHRDSVLFSLKKCIKGYEKLLSALKTVEEECKDEELDNMCALLRNMESESTKELKVLKEVKKTARKSLAGTFQIYTTHMPTDDYFVLPFVLYVDVILMCNVMMKQKSQSFWGNVSNSLNDYLPEPFYDDRTAFLMYAYYLASYFSGSKQYDFPLQKTMGNERMNNLEIKKEFRKILQQINRHLEDSFKVENYSEGSRKYQLVEECMKCTRMMADFRMREKELTKDIKNLERKGQDCEKKIDEFIKEKQEFNDLVKDSLEQSRMLSEEISALLKGN